MSNSDMFNNNLQQTNISDAYKFETFSDYINNKGLNTNFSPTCIFCSFQDSVPLLNDGSFRQCKKCRKQFKALLIK